MPPRTLQDRFAATRTLRGVSLLVLVALTLSTSGGRTWALSAAQADCIRQVVQAPEKTVRTVAARQSVRPAAARAIFGSRAATSLAHVPLAVCAQLPGRNTPLIVRASLLNLPPPAV